MDVVDIPVDAIQPADWNPNQMDEAMRRRLRCSIERFGVMAPLVVRGIGPQAYETVGGTQRLAVLKEIGYSEVSCIVVEQDDAEARLLAQALNRIHGEDDLGLRAGLLRDALTTMPRERVLDLLPETAASLRALASMGQESMAEYLEAWERAQAARLRHLTFQLTPSQLEVVQEALEQILPEMGVSPEGNPNRRGQALYLLCKEWLENRESYTSRRIRERAQNDE